MKPLFAVSLICWRHNNYWSLFSWPVRGETDPELPPHPRQLSRIPLPDHRGPDQLSPTVTYRSETRRPVVIHQRSHSCVYGRYRSFPTDLSALLLGDLYYTRLSLSGLSEHLSHGALLDLYQILHANLSSNVSKVCDADQPSWLKQMQFYLQLFWFPLRSACWLWEFCLSLRQSSLPTPRYDPQARFPNNSRSDTLQPEVSFSVQGEENVEAQPVFALCLQAELVPATVQDYREKLLHLRKLRHDLVQRSLPQGPRSTFQQVLCY